MKIFTFLTPLLLTLASAPLLATPSPLSSYFSVDVLENQEFVVNDENVLFIGHATSFWDGGRTENVARQVIALSQTYPLTKVAIVSDVMLEGDLAKMHYFADTDVDTVILSRAGQHELRFPRLKNIFFLGGNMGRCLCEGIRDVARGIARSNTNKEINFYMIRDGIYDGYPAFSPMRRDAVASFANNFFGSSFRCPLQNWDNKPLQKISDVRVNLYYDGDLIQEMDLEPGDDIPLAALTKTIHIRFIQSSDVKALFDSLYR